jgi:hypothetical protein
VHEELGVQGPSLAVAGIPDGQAMTPSELVCMINAWSIKP